MSEYRPAGFWIRTGAFVIDTSIVYVLVLAMGFSLGMVLGSMGIRSQGAAFAIGATLGVLVHFLYFTILTARGGQTFGKMAGGIGVIRVDGAPVSYGRSLGRCAAYIVSALVVYIGYLMAAFTDQKRALHDYIADTRVVWVQEIGALRKGVVIAIGVLAVGLVPLGIVAAVAIPNVMKMSTVAQERMTTVNLSSLRSALAVYYGDNGRYPADLTTLTTGGKYIQSIPVAKTPRHHPDSADVSSTLNDAGGWYYDNNTADGAIFGTVRVNCTHADSRGAVWSNY